MMRLRWIQNAALFGLVGGSALLLIGMNGGGLVLSLLGIILGLGIGMPAGVANFMLQGYRIDTRLLKAAFGLEKLPLSPPKTPTQPNITVEVEAAPPAPQLTTPNVTSTAATPTPPIAPEEPPAAPTLSFAERQALIDAIQTETDFAILMGYANHKDELVRLYAVQRLGTFDDPVVISALEAARSDPSEVVQRAASLALKRLGLNHNLE